MTTETIAWLTAASAILGHAYNYAKVVYGDVVNAGGVKAIVRRFFNGPDKPTT